MKQVGLSDTNAIRRSKIHKRTISSQWGSGLHFAFYLVHCKSLIHGKSHATPLPVPVADKAKCERKTSLFKAPCNQRKEVLGRKPEFLRASLPKTVANISTRHHGHYWARLFILLPGKRTPVSKVAYLSQFPLHAKLKLHNYTICSSKSNHQAENNQGILTPSITLGSPTADYL